MSRDHEVPPWHAYDGCAGCRAGNALARRLRIDLRPRDEALDRGGARVSQIHCDRHGSLTLIRQEGPEFPTTRGGHMAEQASYFELVYPDGARQKIEHVHDVTAAKATAKAVGAATDQKIGLQRVSPIDVDAPPQKRHASTSD